ncbi:MAG TPA: AbrB/MazE/SpoVT family DNA-binding domain-containing protein [Gammaproteobacteria bacterium]|nr:AbrB/MazE/SpoVT family DNA-binding domain-containing protein [Gammaproteobacteria bacterium]
MSKVTSKLQVTIPKRIAEQCAIKPGDDIDFVATAEGLRVVTASQRGAAGLSVAERLRLFDEATARQRAREAGMNLPATPAADRGWTREELYTRGNPG